MNTPRPVWLIFPVALTVTSLWLIVAGAGSSSLQLGIVIALCILGCLRQAFLFWTKGQKAYAAVTFAAAVLGIVAGGISLLHIR